MRKLLNEDLKNRILSYVREYIDSNGYAPSYREIQHGVGVKSTSTVYDYTRCLEAEGRLSMHANHPTADAKRAKTSSLQRIRLDVADGGVLYLDCSLIHEGEGQVKVTFSGIVDASQMKSPVGCVVGYAPERE